MSLTLLLCCLVLQEIRLNDNALTSIGDGAFDELTQLQYLYLQRNGLTNFDSSRLLDGLKKLEVLDLSCNNLEKVCYYCNKLSLKSSYTVFEDCCRT